MYTRDGKLLHIRANFKAGFFLRAPERERRGDPRVSAARSAAGPRMGKSTEKDIVLLGNFFTGTVAKFSLATGEIVAKAETGVQRSLAGLAQYPG